VNDTTPGTSESGMDTPPIGASDGGAFVNGGYKRTIMRQFVRNALEKVTQVSIMGSFGNITLTFPQGDDAPYQELLSHFATSPSLPAPDFTALLPILQAITSSISLLSPLHHSALVRSILTVPWAISADDRFVKAYQAFCGVLCSSRAEWVSEVVVMAVKGLRWRKSSAIAIRRLALRLTSLRLGKSNGFPSLRMRRRSRGRCIIRDISCSLRIFYR
jgi:hypothetical protein